MASVISASTTSATALNMSADTTGVLQLATGATPTTAVTIDTSQNVGIGTTSPSYKLQVYGASNPEMRLGDAVVTYQLYTEGATAAVMGTVGNHALVYRTNATERMRIDSSGRVGIAKSSSLTGQLNVTNSQGFSNGTGALPLAAIALDGNFGGGLSFIDGSQGYSLWTESNGANFYIRRATTTGAFTGGVFINNAATSWSAASDEKVKDIIEPIENAIEKVSTLRTVIGKYKDEEEGIRHPFLIAQDVEKVLPEAVCIMHEGEDNECLGLSYTDTIPLLVAAIKEQQTIINDLKARIETLETK